MWCVCVMWVVTMYGGVCVCVMSQGGSITVPRTLSLLGQLEHHHNWIASKEQLC